MIMQVKPGAQSAIGRVTATRYKIDCNAVTLRFGGLLHGELEAVHGLHTGVFMTTVGVVGCR